MIKTNLHIMENNAPSQTSTLIERRRLLLAGGALLLSPVLARAGAQREETLSDDVASVMRNSVNNANPARLVFAKPADGARWLRDMSARLARFVPDEAERRRLPTHTPAS